jgi:microcompartment protein CcmK/EutM
MHLARVVGTLVASRKEQTLDGLKFLVIKQCDEQGQPDGSTLIAADAVGAGLDEVVLYASGSSARQTRMTDGRPVDAVIMAIVDELETGGERRYVKVDT